MINTWIISSINLFVLSLFVQRKNQRKGAGNAKPIISFTHKPSRTRAGNDCLSRRFRFFATAPLFINFADRVNNFFSSYYSLTY